MPDITMCRGEVCPLRDTCYRHRAVPDKTRQSYFWLPPYDNERNEYEHYLRVTKHDRLQTPGPGNDDRKREADDNVPQVQAGSRD